MTSQKNAVRPTTEHRDATRPRREQRRDGQDDEFQWPSDDEMERLYGECAEDDHALAEAGLEEYARTLAAIDKDD